MRYQKQITLKDGRGCLLRNGDAADAAETLALFQRTHAETDFLRTYPEENDTTVEDEARWLAQTTESDNAIEVCAFVDGRLVGSAGISPVGTKEKERHRADFGIAIERAHWGLGIGGALTQACVECALLAGYAQVELSAVADNAGAIRLYEAAGFVEYGRNPKGFRSHTTGWQELVEMRLDLEALREG